jgi:chemotaxis signal transduction protein
MTASAPEVFLALRAKARWIAVPAAAVVEVTLMGQVAPVPLAHPGLLGVTLVRGRIVPVVALERLVDVGQAEALSTTLPRLVILASSAELALVADETAGLIELDLARVPRGQGLVAAEVSWAGRLLHVLDVPALIRAAGGTE